MNKNLAYFALYVCAGMVLMMGVFTIGPVVETKFWPAYGKFRLISVEPVNEHQSRAVFEFDKKRICTPAGFAWFNGEVGATSQLVDFTVEGLAGNGPSRPIGLNITSPYLLDVSPNDVRTKLVGEIYSRCHPFWVTRSEVYP